MTFNKETNGFSALIASCHSTCALTNREAPARALEVVLKDATTAPSRSNTYALRLALATGERAQCLHERYRRLLDEEIEAHARKAEDPTVEIPVPDGDYPACKRYSDELRPAQTEVVRLPYGIYGAERGDIEGRNRVNRRNVVAFNAPAMGLMPVHEDMPPWSAMGTGFMFQTLFLSAKSRRVDSCSVGILATWCEPMDAEFEIPEHYRFITGFTLGYADPEAPINVIKAPRPPIQFLDGR